MSLPEKEMLNRVDLSSRRNDINDGMVLTDDGRAFQARVAAGGKARSPSVAYLWQAMWWKPSVADWGDDVFAGCIISPIVHLKGHYGWPQSA